MSSTGTTDLDLDLFPAGGCDHGHRTRPPARKRATSLDRPHGGGQADPLRGPVQQGVEPLQAEGQVRAAFGAGDRVHLVDDDRLHAAQCLPAPGW